MKQVALRQWDSGKAFSYLPVSQHKVEHVLICCDVPICGLVSPQRQKPAAKDEGQARPQQSQQHCVTQLWDQHGHSAAAINEVMFSFWWTATEEPAVLLPTEGFDGAPGLRSLPYSLKITKSSLLEKTFKTIKTSHQATFEVSSLNHVP